MNYKPVDNTLCLSDKFKRTAYNVSLFYENALAPSGLTPRHFSILNNISKCTPCTVGYLSEHTSLDPSTLSRHLTTLMNDGLIEDIKEDGTKKNHFILTDRGKEAYTQGKKCWEHAQNMMKEVLGEHDLETMYNVMEKIRTLPLGQ